MSRVTRSVAHGDVLWQASADRLAASGIGHYLAWLAERGLRFDDHRSLWTWSTRDLDAFWASVWDYFEVGDRPAGAPVLAADRMPGAVWFPDARVNYAQRALSAGVAHDDAFVEISETRGRRALTRSALRAQVARAASSLRDLGVTAGDRVAAYLPHCEEALVGLLASAAIGAVWTICPPDVGVAGVLNRWRQIEPKVIIGIDGYRYRGRSYPCADALSEISAALPSAQAVVLVEYSGEDGQRLTTRCPKAHWDALVAEGSDRPHFEPLPFDHPLWILFSSGTTGPPKGIVHGHGGILVEHLKSLNLQHDVRAGDRMMWHTSTGWMMWNLSVSGLALGVTVIAYDGDVKADGGAVVWDLAEAERVTALSIGAPLLSALHHAGVAPRSPLRSLRTVGATGAPIAPAVAGWLYEVVDADIMFTPGSGGTDVCSGLVGPSTLLPVRAGELAGPCLGVAVECFDDAGAPVRGVPGELVVTRPMPSMPICLWNDAEDARYRSAYFERFPGVWHHGDRASISATGSWTILGRSDATLNRSGIRLGTADFYPVVDSVPGVTDSLVVHLDRSPEELIVLISVSDDADTDAVQATITQRLTVELSRHHRPDRVVVVPALPRTLNGKRLEVPIKRLLCGAPVSDVLDPSAVTNSAALADLAELAASLSGEDRRPPQHPGGMP